MPGSRKRESMSSATVIILQAFVTLAHAKDLPVVVHHLGDAQDSINNSVDKLVQRMASKLSDPVLNSSPLHHADLQNTMLGKPSQSLVSTPQLSSSFPLPGRSFPTSRLRPLFSMRSVPKGVAEETAAALQGASHGSRSVSAQATEVSHDSRSISAQVATMPKPASAGVHTPEWGNPKDFAKAFPNVEEELQTVPLSPIRGSIPPELRGTLFRNGPGRIERSGQSVHHPFDGDGMIVALRFTDEGVTLCNRFVRTEGWLLEEEAGKFLYRGVFGTQKPGGLIANALDLRLKNIANTHVVQLGDQLLALWEAGGPHALDPVSLETHGLSNLNGVLKPWEKFSAHPRFDPGHHGTPRMVAFGVFPGPVSTIRLMEFATEGPEAGQLISSRHDVLPGFAFIHDFAITPNWAVFLRNPLSMNPLPFVLGQKGAAQVLESQEDGQAKFWLIPRDCGKFAGQQPRVLDAPPGFVFHHANAWEDGDDVVVESLYYKEFQGLLFDNHQDFRKVDFEEYPEGVLKQVRVNLDGSGYSTKLLNKRPGEFPTVNPRYQGLPARYSWMSATNLETNSEFMDGPLQSIMKVDQVNGDRQAWSAGSRGFVNEPEMVPRPGSDAEDDGWVLTLVWNSVREGTDLVILNAHDMSEQAVLELPLGIPQGLHGSWVQHTPGDTIPDNIRASGKQNVQPEGVPAF